jgi:ankyrin repeat protein
MGLSSLLSSIYVGAHFPHYGSLMESIPVFVNNLKPAIDKNGHSALIVAAQNGHRAIVTMLKKAGIWMIALLDWKNPMWGGTEYE